MVPKVVLATSIANWNVCGFSNGCSKNTFWASLIKQLVLKQIGLGLIFTLLFKLTKQTIFIKKIEIGFIF
jgi:hypothetical protein